MRGKARNLRRTPGSTASRAKGQATRPSSRISRARSTARMALSYLPKYGARISFQASTGCAPTTRRPLTMKVGVASTWSRSPSA